MLTNIIDSPGILVIAFFIVILAVMAYQFIKDANDGTR